MASIFPFMELPAELRELIYYQAFQPLKPIDTAAIPNTPDLVLIQPIAQLDQQTRHEALHILFTSRPVEISLHSPENVRRALLWASNWRTHTRALPQLIFSGKIQQCEGNFFSITLRISDEMPYFTASAKPGASENSDKIIAAMKRDMLSWLEVKLSGVEGGKPAKLSGAEVVELIGMVAQVGDVYQYVTSALAQQADRERKRLEEVMEVMRPKKSVWFPKLRR